MTVSPLRYKHGLILLLILGWFASAGKAAALELVSSDACMLDVSGSFKTIYLGTHDSPFSRGHDSSINLLRLMLTGTVSDKASFEFHVVESATINPASSSVAGFSAFSPAERFRAERLNHTQTTHEDFSAGIAIDRANISLHFEHCDVTIGRQAISLGTTYFWNPNDLLATFSPYEFDRDYKPGVDGAVVDFPLGDFSGITLLYGAGKHMRLNDSTLLLRAYTTINDFDLSVTAGRYREDGFVGADFSGEFGPGIGIRGGLAYFAAEDDNDFLQAVLGAEYRFENNLLVSAEYFFNGYGTLHHSNYFDTLTSERIRDGDMYNISRHYLGILGSYELTPLLRISLAVIMNLSDHSMLIDPTLVYSLSDNAELVAGLIISSGHKPRGFRLRSEFGTYPDFSFVEMKYYF